MLVAELCGSCNCFVFILSKMQDMLMPKCELAFKILFMSHLSCHFSISGTSDGQTKVIREGDNGVAYAWNMREQNWDKVFLSLSISLSQNWFCIS